MHGHQTPDGDYTHAFGGAAQFVRSLETPDELILEVVNSEGMMMFLEAIGRREIAGLSAYLAEVLELMIEDDIEREAELEGA